MLSKRLLLLEDDRDQAANIQRMLNLHGYETHVVFSESAFLHWLSDPDFIPSAAILDVMVRSGGRDLDYGDVSTAGIRCLEKFQAALPTVPVILYSQLTQSQAAYQGTASFLTKRAGHNLLVARLNSVVSNRLYRTALIQ